MFELMCRKNDYIFSEESQKRIHQLICDSVANKGENFANGRMVRNLFEDAVMNHARRVDRLDNPDKKQLMTIELDDLSETFNA